MSKEPNCIALDRMHKEVILWTVIPVAIVLSFIIILYLLF